MLLSVIALSIVTALVGCAASANRPAPPTSGLLALLHGQRESAGALILNERRGTFAGLTLGMPMGKARETMPSAYYWPLHLQENWCEQLRGHTCIGLRVRLDGVCKISDCTAISPPLFLNEIQLSALTNPSRISESRQATTLKGIHLGTSMRVIETRYASAQPAVADCTETAPAEAKAIVAVAGVNTLLFSIFQGKVWVITLISGKHPHACNDGHAY
ncbi:MAG TPA: hypothetical protein VFW85_10545 [Gaiellaceae bacterium]|nr:hypothetical protein [Gaiellaceae bacterium]